MFITVDHLEKLRTDFIEKRSLGKLFEIKNQHSRFSRYDEVTIFLSHKHSDKDLVENVIALLNYVNVKVYVDWLDNEMPALTNVLTAEKIKTKIASNHKFILLATNDAIESKWCNWELGYADAKKNISNIAVIPIADSTNGWKGNEYLGLYPYVTTDYHYLFTGYYVEFKGKKTKLEDWLRT